ncbi:MAG: 30S ribosomal protein S6e [Methanosarcinaceae archaeon]|jgi:small subunit ribosomal protein S6e|nr:30S ribosomal protein S6e [Methanosarcinaceae archaeon]NKQ39654.1 30S ribosomal protein S6e [Methanosarcinales archaeon]
MASFKVVVSDPKSKTYQFEIEGAEANKYIGKSIGDTIDGETVGLSGYTLKITGGSDLSGIMMRKDLPGSKRRRILLAGKTYGYKPSASGVRRRKFIRGKDISPDIVQINTKVVEYGGKDIAAILGLEEKVVSEGE